MTEPTEADFAAYDAAVDRALAYWGSRDNHDSGPSPSDCERDELAQAIAEARAQGRREAIEEWAARLEGRQVLREHAGMSAVENMNFLIETTASEMRESIADVPTGANP